MAKRQENELQKQMAFASQFTEVEDLMLFVVGAFQKNDTNRNNTSIIQSKLVNLQKKSSLLSELVITLLDEIVEPTTRRTGLTTAQQTQSLLAAEIEAIAGLNQVERDKVLQLVARYLALKYFLLNSQSQDT